MGAKFSMSSSKKRKATALQAAAESSIQHPDLQFDDEDWDPPSPEPSSLNRRDTSRRGPHKLFTKDENLEDRLVGVIVTISDGSSYDPMFQQVRPTTVPGERISTYAITCQQVKDLHVFLSSMVPVPEDQEEWISLLLDVRSVPADSVVFNWECCSGCGDHPFPCSDQQCGQRGGRANRFRGQDIPQSSSITMQFMGFALRAGFTVMCSDFSLKSLISEWSEQELGPNPFLKVGGCSGQFSLDFIPEELQNEEVPQQLQVVGELCADRGKAIVEAMGDTIVYTVNPKRTETELYTLKVLTVVADLSDCGTRVPEELKCVVGEAGAQKKGSAGHVTLTYAEGGQLVTSMGHWIELTRIDASADSVMRAAMRNFGADEMNQFNRELEAQSTEEERSSYLQTKCQEYVTKSAPSRMKCRTKF